MMTTTATTATTATAATAAATAAAIATSTTTATLLRLLRRRPNPDWPCLALDYREFHRVEDQLPAAV